MIVALYRPIFRIISWCVSSLNLPNEICFILRNYGFTYVCLFQSVAVISLLGAKVVPSQANGRPF